MCCKHAEEVGARANNSMLNIKAPKYVLFLSILVGEIHHYPRLVPVLPCDMHAQSGTTREVIARDLILGVLCKTLQGACQIDASNARVPAGDCDLGYASVGRVAIC